MMKNLLLFSLLLFFLNGYSQTDEATKFYYTNTGGTISFYTYSEKYITEKGEPNLSRFLQSRGSLKYYELPDLPDGSYRFFLKVTDNCKLYFDEKKQVTHLETQVKFNLKKEEINTLNKVLLLNKVVHYHDDILVNDCQKNNFLMPATLNY